MIYKGFRGRKSRINVHFFRKGESMKNAFKMTCFIFGITILFLFALVIFMFLFALFFHLFLPTIISLIIGGILSIFITIFVVIYIDMKYEER